MWCLLCSRRWKSWLRSSRTWNSSGKLWDSFGFWQHLHLHHESSFGKRTFSYSPVFLPSANENYLYLNVNHLFSIFTGASGQPSAVQVRLLLVPGGHCDKEWKQILSCWRSGFCKSVKIRILFEGDSRWHAVSCWNCNRKSAKFCNFLSAILHCFHHLCVPLVMRLAHQGHYCTQTTNSMPVLLLSGCFVNALQILRSNWLKMLPLNQFQQSFYFYNNFFFFFYCVMTFRKMSFQWIHTNEGQLSCYLFHSITVVVFFT